MGDRPTTLDATAYGFLTNILYAPIESPLKTYTEELPQLAAYCERMKELFYT
jgi:glutathione S-transferase